MNKKVSAKDVSQTDGSTNLLFNFNHSQQLLPLSQEQFRCGLIRSMIQTMCYQFFIAFVSLMSLFTQDINEIAFSPRQDIVFNVIDILIVCIFVADFVLNTVSIRSYQLSFYFWLDIATILGMLLDVRLFTQLLFSGINNHDLNRPLSYYNSNTAVRSLLQNSENGKIATKVIRILRIFRMMRIIKLYKSLVKVKKIKTKTNLKKKIRALTEKNLYQNNHSNSLEQNQKTPQSINIFLRDKSKQNTQTNSVSIKQEEQQEASSPKYSKISQIISDKILTKVVSAILLISFIVPLFDSSHYQTSKSIDMLVNSLEPILVKKDINMTLAIKALNYSIGIHSLSTEPIVYFGSPFNQFPRVQFSSDSQLTLSNLVIVFKYIDINRILALYPELSLRQNQEPTIVVVSSSDISANYQSQFLIGRTLYISAVFLIILNCFKKSTDRLIVRPIEDMMERVKDVEKNPDAINLGFDNQTQYETAIVSNSLIKISNLLSTVYGNSGVRVIVQSMFGHNNHSLSTGKKKYAIYGFCRIRDFSDASQVLHEDLLIFVNLIADIVHSATYRYGGSACQNDGETLLLIWCIPQNKYIVDDSDDTVMWVNDKYIHTLSDFSVFSFVKSLVKLQKQPMILRYRKDQRLLQRLGAKYTVGVRFGLHFGWAIEGVIGSDHKIDVSHIGTHIDRSKRLTSICQIFNVPFVITKEIYNLLSPYVKNLCRSLGLILLKHEVTPKQYYFVDVDLSNISRPVDKAKKRQTLLSQMDAVLKREINLTFLEQDGIQYNSQVFIEQKKQLREALFYHKNNRSDFYETYEAGLKLYFEGQWYIALKLLNAALKCKPDDQPTSYFIRQIQKKAYFGKPPKTWKGYTLIDND